jgi:hypothetical protein
MEDSRIDDLIDQVRSLTIEVESLKQELRRRESSSPPSSAQPRAEDTQARRELRVGDRVRILNRFSKPAVWDNRKRWVEAEAKTATVTKVRTRQVFFVTDNGVETWRAPNNLKLL